MVGRWPTWLVRAIHFAIAVSRPSTLACRLEFAQSLSNCQRAIGPRNSLTSFPTMSLFSIKPGYTGC